jgi:hypothetical protein
MKFPVTRERLQAFQHVEERLERAEGALEERIGEVVKEICNDFTRYMYENFRQQRYVWKKLSGAFQVNPYKCFIPIEEQLEKFLVRLRQTFLGCDISINSAKTHVIIDWT